MMMTHPYLDSQIEVRANLKRWAGAVQSIKWRGHEFVDKADHGRLMQTHILVNGQGECNNPTEAGSRDDGAGLLSSSRLLSKTILPEELHTITQMAYWLSAGQTGIGCHGPSTKPRLSNYLLFKTIIMAPDGIDNAIRVITTVLIPEDFSSLVVGFNLYSQDDQRFYAWNRDHERLEEIVTADTKIERDEPVALITRDSRFAIAVVSYNQDPIYRLRRFSGTDKWVVIHKFSSGPKYSVLTFSYDIILGDLPGVETTLKNLLQ